MLNYSIQLFIFCTFIIRVFFELVQSSTECIHLFSQQTFIRGLASIRHCKIIKTKLQRYCLCPLRNLKSKLGNKLLGKVNPVLLETTPNYPQPWQETRAFSPYIQTLPHLKGDQKLASERSLGQREEHVHEHEQRV